jgi:potassium-transporting ATPase KdpC subunit
LVVTVRRNDMDLTKHFVPAILLTLVLTVLTGLVYPLAVTGIALVLFPHQARGSLIVDHGGVAGSELIGQPFTGPGFFHGRPSAAGAAGSGYDATASSGSNLGPTSQVLAERLAGSVKELGPLPAGTRIPSDLVTASGSGLDPHISPAAAELQVARVARERGLSEEAVRRLVRQATEGPQWGFLGEPRVNVLLLNRSLNRVLAARPDMRAGMRAGMR